MSALKIIVVGPQECGKTLVSNIIAEMTDSDYLRYEPTEGVRILEIEYPSRSDSAYSKNFEIELWDCAGSQRYQSCWPIIQLDTHGIIFVFNPQMPELMPELELLYDYFAVQNGLSDSSCMVFINQRGNNNAEESSINLSQRFKSTVCKTLNVSGNPNGVRQQFSNFIDNLLRKTRL